MNYIIYSFETGEALQYGTCANYEEAKKQEQEGKGLLVAEEIPAGTFYVKGGKLVSVGHRPAPWFRFDFWNKVWVDQRSVQEVRSLAYPSLAEFADAFYWMQRGDESKMQAYITACDKVKKDFPK